MTELLRPHSISFVVFFPSRPWKIPQASFLNSLLYLYLIVKWKYQGTGYSILVPQYFSITLTAKLNKLLKLPLGFTSSYYPEEFCICNSTICAPITFHVAALKTFFVVPWALNQAIRIWLSCCNTDSASLFTNIPPILDTLESSRTAEDT